MSTVEITIADAWTGLFHDRKPVSAVAETNGHIHARLGIGISGKPLPQLGYFGPDDVCLNFWGEQFCRIVEAFRGAETVEYVYDEGEQGQPAYLFRRDGTDTFVSVIDSEIGEGDADPDYQDVRCATEDFVAALDGALQSMRTMVIAEAGEAGEAWWADLVVGTYLEDDRVLEILERHHWGEDQ